MHIEDQKVIEILFEIEADSSRNGKLATLERHRYNEPLKSILEYTYNPYKVYGIGSKAFGKKYQVEGEVEFRDIIELLEYLLKNNTGSDNTKMKVNAFILQQPEEYRDMFKKIIMKDLKIGITSGSINKVWDELVPVFDVMLAKPFERLPKRAGSELKFDGVRATAVKINGSSTLFTRNGKMIEGFDDIIEQLNRLPIDNYVLDGELISNNSYKQTMEKVFKKTVGKQADYMIFDMLPLSEFNAGVSKKTYEFRRLELTEFFQRAEFKPREKFKNLVIAPVLATFENPTIEQLNELTEKAIEDGYEGTMVKDLDGLYYTKRTFDWQKMKQFIDGDFEIIRIERGKGKNKNRMGKVIIDVNGVEVGLGSGWSDEERDDMWINPNKYIGLLVEVQYQEIIEKTGSLRFPTVKGIRWDR